MILGLCTSAWSTRDTLDLIHLRCVELPILTTSHPDNSCFGMHECALKFGNHQCVGILVLKEKEDVLRSIAQEFRGVDFLFFIGLIEGSLIFCSGTFINGPQRRQLGFHIFAKLAIDRRQSRCRLVETVDVQLNQGGSI